jgi:cysteine desulfurase
MVAQTPVIPNDPACNSEGSCGHGIYLDYNATTPLLPEVVDAMLPYLREHFGNPSSGHAYGGRARAAVAHAREQVARLLGCDGDEVVFTSGGTEANNLAIRGVTEVLAHRRHIVTTVIEHPATARPCAWLEGAGRSVTRIGVDADGRACVDAARAAIGADTALVTVMHSNNETGALQPIEALAQLARAGGALIHTDAAQSLGKVPVRVRDLDIDLLSVAGHKLYAPKGVGVLYVKRGTSIAPFALGASHERGLRPGTENVASIVGLGMACEAVGRDLDIVASRVRRLRDSLWERLASGVPGLALNGHAELRLPNTLNVRFPRVTGTAVLECAPEVAASTGSACHEGHESASPVILAMGLAVPEALGSVRLSLGRGTTEDDVVRAAEALIRAWRRLAE